MESLLLSTTYNNYPAFSPNQVLSDNQLNHLRDFLDQQNRLGRVRNVGVGLVCGLHADYQYDEESKAHSIKVSPGFGITSDGFIAEVNSDSTLVFSSYRRYPGVDLNKDDLEDYGWMLDEGAKENRLLELLSTEAMQQGIGLETNDENPPKELIADVILNHILVLFIELSKEDSDLCVITQCNNLGHNISLKPKFLLVHKDLVSDNKDSLLKMVPEKPRPFSPALFVPSLGAAIQIIKYDSLLAGNEKNSSDPKEPEFDECILSELFNIKDGEPISNLNTAYGCIVRSIANRFLKPHNSIETVNGSKMDINEDKKDTDTCILRLVYDEYKDFLNLHEIDIDELINCLEIQIGTDHVPVFTQYHFDYVRDLVCAYNEFIEAVCKLTRECFAPRTFPRHLFLTLFSETPSKLDTEFNADETYRHHFCPAPTKNVQYGEWNHVRNLFLRMAYMIMLFSDEIAKAEKASTKIAITPSHDDTYPLGERAIPFYYYAEPDMNRFKSLWQPAQTCTIYPALNYYDNDNVMSSDDKRGSGQIDRQNMGDMELKIDFPDSYLNDPLYFTWHKKAFWKIEGHIGMDAASAYTEIEMLRNKFNLSFELLVAYVQDDNENTDEMSSVNVDIPMISLDALIQQNCGITHTGGVSCVGTFVLVAKLNSETGLGKVYADFTICRPITKMQLATSKSVSAGPTDFKFAGGEGINFQPAQTEETESEPIEKVSSSNLSNAYLDGRRLGYYREVVNLNSTGDFEKNRNFQIVTQFLSQKPSSISEASANIKEIIAKGSAQTNRQGTSQARKLAYLLMMEKSFMLYADTIVENSRSVIPEDELPVLQEVINDLKNAGADITKLSTKWQSTELVQIPIGIKIINMLK